ncbi:MAG: hypothetical protein F6J87_07560 [Spirulina sp. SIO3F2]|nr:hypothetical protein [Spirulina sp. SIO3F2]
MMTASILPIPQPIALMFTRAIANQVVTEADRYNFMAALLDLDRDLNSAECQAVDQILGTIGSGRLSLPRNSH